MKCFGCWPYSLYTSFPRGIYGHKADRSARASPSLMNKLFRLGFAASPPRINEARPVICETYKSNAGRGNESLYSTKKSGGTEEGIAASVNKNLKDGNRAAALISIF